ncbi:SDR family oxidoreductase [Brunnivagina elsteri]|uniref:Short-chain dehydrogenase/reductase n=1 Tax=Brunnivagina elsteri CCALA 953 TaxID=987040 RepID=A0A2A2TAP3_9CYAN|nr:SDR family oxidoreductase [Calothrix elsteri]PAX47326.1 short-chain dehydrogenase/reductase [Calothrix elsteri CCALA 953]
MANQLNKTILITGTSSGIGLETAKIFQNQGWNVVATMRNPDQNSELAKLPNILCLPLDVTQTQTIQTAIDGAIARFGTIDALVNNAGYGLIGVFEACSPEEIERQFATNVFGLMAVTRGILPHFRDRKQGILVNIASIGGKMVLPLYSPYHSTKWAVEGFSESLHFELKQFNIKVKIIEPGPIKTDFYGRSMTVSQKPGLTDYDDYSNRVLPQLQQAGAGSPPSVTAKVIYRAVTDGSWKLRYPAGGNASLLLTLRKFLPDVLFHSIIKAGLEREAAPR